MIEIPTFSILRDEVLTSLWRGTSLWIEGIHPSHSQILEEWLLQECIKANNEMPWELVNVVVNCASLEGALSLHEEFWRIVFSQVFQKEGLPPDLADLCYKLVDQIQTRQLDRYDLEHLLQLFTVRHIRMAVLLKQVDHLLFNKDAYGVVELFCNLRTFSTRMRSLCLFILSEEPKITFRQLPFIGHGSPCLGAFAVYQLERWNESPT